MISLRHLLCCIIAVAGLTSHNAAAHGLRPAGEAEKLGYSPGDTVLVIPASVRSLPPFCFAGCDDLVRVTFADGSQCSEIGEFCFAECTALRRITLPPSLRVMGEGMLRECRALENLTVPSGVPALPKELCLRCSSLENISMPPHHREIGSFVIGSPHHIVLKPLHYR